MATGKGTSGSTGWSNSVRSRLYLDRVRDDEGREPDEDARVLRSMKSNYSRAGTEIALRWQGGVFVPERVSMSGDPLAAQAKAERVFLELLGKHESQCRTVSASPSLNYAPKIFEAEARAQGVGKAALKAAMERLLDSGRIRNEPYGAKSRGTHRLVSVNG
jgi:RecA-family ATPase